MCLRCKITTGVSLKQNNKARAYSWPKAAT